jgi:hypothetical protein
VRAFVRFIPACDHLLQMPVLRLYQLVSRVATVKQITWSTELITGHRLHSRFLLVVV